MRGVYSNHLHEPAEMDEAGLATRVVLANTATQRYLEVHEDRLVTSLYRITMRMIERQSGLVDPNINSPNFWAR